MLMSPPPPFFRRVCMGLIPIVQQKVSRRFWRLSSSSRLFWHGTFFLRYHTGVWDWFFESRLFGAAAAVLPFFPFTGSARLLVMYAAPAWRIVCGMIRRAFTCRVWTPATFSNIELEKEKLGEKWWKDSFNLSRVLFLLSIMILYSVSCEPAVTCWGTFFSLFRGKLWKCW